MPRIKLVPIVLVLSGGMLAPFLNAQDGVRITVNVEAQSEVVANTMLVSVRLMQAGKDDAEVVTGLEKLRAQVVKGAGTLGIPKDLIRFSVPRPEKSPRAYGRFGSAGRSKMSQVASFRLPIKYKEPGVKGKTEEATAYVLQYTNRVEQALSHAADFSANEAAAWAACRTYAEAQDIYRRTDWDGDGVLEYAQAIRGNFSLFERTAGKADITLVDAAFANAAVQTGRKPVPKAGYLYKILTGQGQRAPGGRKSYIRGKNMTLGYGLLAYPAVYGKTGRLTLIINNTGTVYARNLGANTNKLVTDMIEYDPGPLWQVYQGGGGFRGAPIQVSVQYVASKKDFLPAATQKALASAEQMAQGMAGGMAQFKGRKKVDLTLLSVELAPPKQVDPADFYRRLRALDRIKLSGETKKQHSPDDVVSEVPAFSHSVSFRVLYLAK